MLSAWREDMGAYAAQAAAAATDQNAELNKALLIDDRSCDCSSFGYRFACEVVIYQNR